MTPDKLQAIREYLFEHFPYAKHLDDKNDFDRFGHKFRIVTKDQVLLTSISRQFIEDNEASEIVKVLDKIGIVDLLKENPTATIVVKSDGRLDIVPRN